MTLERLLTGLVISGGFLGVLMVLLVWFYVAARMVSTAILRTKADFQKGGNEDGEEETR